MKETLTLTPLLTLTDPIILQVYIILYRHSTFPMWVNRSPSLGVFVFRNKKGARHHPENWMVPGT